MRERPAMTRRPGPPEDPQAHERMRAILDGHKGRIETSRVEQRSARVAHNHEVAGSNPAPATTSIASGPAGQEAGEVRGVPPAGKTPLVQLPMGYDPKADPPALEWLTPVQHPNGEAAQTSSGGAYAVFARRTPQGIAYIARHGLDALGVSRESAQNAREMCERHYAKVCGADNGDGKHG